MIKVILISIITSFLVSFYMMKFQMKMIEKWMDDFFEKEKEYIQSTITQHKD